MNKSHCISIENGQFDAFVDGELSLEKQGIWFSHLSTCESCRLELDTYLTFRKAVRNDFVTVTPSVDDAFLYKLDGLRKKKNKELNWEHQPLRKIRVPVSLRTIGIAATIVFLVGLIIPLTTPATRTEILPVRYVAQEQERVQFDELTDMLLIQPYPLPGLVVEGVSDK